MKKINFIRVICLSLLFCFVACEKEQQVEEPTQPIVGSWSKSKLVKGSNSYLVIDTITFSANGDYLEVDGIYNIIEPHNLIGKRILTTGTYDIKADSLIEHRLQSVYSLSINDTCYPVPGFEPYDWAVKYAISNDTLYCTVENNGPETCFYLRCR